MIPRNLDKLYLARAALEGDLNPNFEARLPKPRTHRPTRRETLAEYLRRGGTVTKVPAGYADSRLIVLQGGD